MFLMDSAKPRAIFSLLVLVFLIGITFSQGEKELDLVEESANFVPEWWQLCAVGLGIGIGFISLTFAIGHALNLPTVKAFARQEVYEALTTVIILSVVIAALMAYGIFSKNIVLSAMTESQADGDVPIYAGYCSEMRHLYDTSDAQHPENALFATADWFLGCMPISADSGRLTPEKKDEFDEILRELDNREIYGQTHSSYWDELENITDRDKGVMLGHMMNTYVSLLTLEFILGPVSTFGVSAYATEALVSTPQINFAPNAGLTPISEALIMLTDLTGMGLVVLFVQKVLLQFFHQNALQVFLPLGVAFRGIPFLRKTGSTIIVAALVMFFIFPMTIWMNQQIYFNMLENPQSSLIDWTDYQSMVELCQVHREPLTGEYETRAEFTDRVEGQMVDPHIDSTKGIMGTFIRDVFGADMRHPESSDENSLPNKQFSIISESFFQNLVMVFDYTSHVGFLFGPVLPVDFLFEAMVDQFTTAMQFFVLNLLFLVNTIIICLTLFKDLSIAIGGEPRIFGMSKLV